MTTITQTGTPKYSPSIPKSYEKDPIKDELFDDFSPFMCSTTSTQKHDRDFEHMGFDVIEPIESNTNISSMFSPSTNKSKSNSVISSQVASSRNSSTTTSSSTNRQTAGDTKYTTHDNDEAQKKFGSAKAISSDQFFNNESSSFERAANLAKFQGSNSISSSDYFNDGPVIRGGSKGGISGSNSSRSKFFAIFLLKRI